MECEMRVDNLILRLQGRVVEVFATDSDYSHRLHVDTVAFESAPPGRDGEVKVRMGRLENGGLSRGSTRTKLSMDADQFERFRAFVEAVKAAQASGPEAW
jgi:hypothetical protein